MHEVRITAIVEPVQKLHVPAAISRCALTHHLARAARVHFEALPAARPLAHQMTAAVGRIGHLVGAVSGEGDPEDPPHDPAEIAFADQIPKRAVDFDPYSPI